jgi:hypothetical protein
MNHKQNKLIKDIEKRFTTVMIGSLARFEETFGHLWETEDEEGDHYHDLWQNIRRDILNFGNHQSRTGIENMYKHFIEDKSSPKTYEYEIKFNHKKGDKYEN